MMIWLATEASAAKPCQIVRLFLLLLIVLSVKAFAQDPLSPPNAVPVFFTNIPPHLLATQFNLSAGTGRLSRSDKPVLSVSGEVKGMYNLTGAIYLSTGGGFTSLHSQEKVAIGEESRNRDGLLLYFPSGIGFTMGDDRASIITGIDFLPGFYTGLTPEPANARRFALGLGPEFGFLFRAGPRYTKGLLIGMVGKIQFMQPPNVEEGSSLRYTYGGLGLVIRFY
jgi:hypothetical protein